MTRNSRPKWARKLTAKDWKGLQNCQNTKRPTLRQLRDDVKWQDSCGMHCSHCRHCLRVALGAW